MIFVDNIKTEKDGKRILVRSQISAVMKMSFKDKRMLFLLPIQIYAGLLPGFVAVDFSKVYQTILSYCVQCSEKYKNKSFTSLNFFNDV